MSEYGMVIIGAGEAGARAAVELRTRGWQGPVTLIGDERERPYERPPLSKRHLSGEETPLPATILDQSRLDEYGITLLAGEAALRIHRGRHEIELAGGRNVRYERLLLATGANPRRLRTAGDGAADAFYLRRFADALKLRDRMRPGSRIAVIGGGFIGLEVAASAVARECRVTLVEAAPRILMRGVPSEIAAMAEARHRAAGVEFRIGTGIAAIDRSSSGRYAIRLEDGTIVEADTVIAGIGAVPETALAEACGLELENGIKVNEYLATSDPDIYAAGDCCSFPHPLYGGRRIRLEAWRNAQDQGTHAAANLLGAETPFAAIPWFWSDQYELTLQVAGLSDSGDATVVRDLGEAGRLIFHAADDGRLTAVSGMGPSGALAKSFRLAEMLLEKGGRPDLAALADPGASLKAMLRAQ